MLRFLFVFAVINLCSFRPSRVLLSLAALLIVLKSFECAILSIAHSVLD